MIIYSWNLLLFHFKRVHYKKLFHAPGVKGHLKCSRNLYKDDTAKTAPPTAWMRLHRSFFLLDLGLHIPAQTGGRSHCWRCASGKTRRRTTWPSPAASSAWSRRTSLVGRSTPLTASCVEKRWAWSGPNRTCTDRKPENDAHLSHDRIYSRTADGISAFSSTDVPPNLLLQHDKSLSLWHKLITNQITATTSPQIPQN